MDDKTLAKLPRRETIMLCFGYFWVGLGINGIRVHSIAEIAFDTVMATISFLCARSIARTVREYDQEFWNARRIEMIIILMGYSRPLKFEEIYAAMGAGGKTVSREEASTSIALMNVIKIVDFDEDRRTYTLLPRVEHERFVSETLYDGRDALGPQRAT